MPEFAYDVFLSHSSKDKAAALDIAKRLRSDGLKVWFDEWEIKPGDSIPAKIEEGLEHSRVLVLCMSKHAFGSDWAQLEAGTFRFKDPQNKERRFIPLRSIIYRPGSKPDDKSCNRVGGACSTRATSLGRRAAVRVGGVRLVLTSAGLRLESLL